MYGSGFCPVALATGTEAEPQMDNITKNLNSKFKNTIRIYGNYAVNDEYKSITENIR